MPSYRIIPTLIQIGVEFDETEIDATTICFAYHGKLRFLDRLCDSGFCSWYIRKTFFNRRTSRQFGKSNSWTS
jgi:hypothetical protein